MLFHSDQGEGTMPDLHAKFSPSGAGRWMQCTASPALEAKFPEDDKPKDAADRGTCYHEVGEIMIRRMTYPHTSAAQVTKAESKRAFKFAYAHVLKHGTGKVPAETAARLMNLTEADTLAKSYADWVVGTFGKEIAAGAPFEAEGKSKVLTDMWGTVDFHIVVGSTLHIIDLKTGRIPVSPIENMQLLTYATGLATRHINEVVLTIFQDGRPDSLTVPVDRVRAHYRRLMEVYQEAKLGGETKAGEHCFWCRAKNDCSTYAERGLQIAQEEFGHLGNSDPELTIRNIDSETAGKMLEAFSVIEDWMKTALPILTERAYQEGLKVDGYKLIRGLKHKAWQDKSDAEKALKKILGDKAYTKKILTPNQAIKLAGEDACAGLWTIPTGEIKLVTEATRGKEVTASAAIEFADEGEA